MKKLQRFVAGLLTCSMLFGMAPFSAFAANNLDETNALSSDASEWSDADWEAFVSGELTEDDLIRDDEGEIAAASADSAESTAVTLTDGETASGYCGGEGDGTNLTWSLVDGVLTISGEGEMDEYGTTDSPHSPWYDYRRTITSVIIENGVTSIGEFAFDSTSLTSVNLPNSLTFIGDCAFQSCKSLPSINLPDGLTSIGGYAFNLCKSLTSVYLPDSLTSIDEFAFSWCESLSTIKFTGDCPIFGDCCFLNITATAYYPNTWTEVPSSTVGGATNITWVAYDPDEPSIDPSICEHTNTAVINYKKATETEDGYTGDIKCFDCGQIITPGIVIPAGEGTKEVAGVFLTFQTNKLEDESDYVLYKVTVKALSMDDGNNTYNLKVTPSVGCPKHSDWGDEVKVEGGSGITHTQILFILPPLETETFEWDIYIPKQEESATYQFGVTVTSDNTFQADSDKYKWIEISASGKDDEDDTFVFGVDNYSFVNGQPPFVKSEPYYITDEDFEVYKKLGNDDLKKVAKRWARGLLKETNFKNKKLVDWDGACLGMSLTMAFFKTGLMDATEWPNKVGGTAENTYQIIAFDEEENSALESMLNTYQIFGKLFNHPVYENGSDDAYRTLGKMWNMAESIGSSGQQLFIVSMSKDNETGHAVVCYGADTGDFSADGTVYHKRLRIADPNEETEQSLYISDDFGEAYYKGSATANSEDPPIVFNCFGYYHETLEDMMNMNFPGLNKMTIIQTQTMDNFEIRSNGKAAAVVAGKVSGGSLGVGYSPDVATDGDSDDENSIAEFVIEEKNSSYTITPTDGDTLDATIYYDGIALEVTGSATSATYNEDGTVTVEGADGEIEINAAINDGNLSFASVKGETSGDVTVKFNADSLTVSGDITDIKASNSDIDGNTSEIELGEDGTAYADENGELSTKKDAPYTITLECNGGECASETLKTDEYGQLTDLPDPERDGYTFKGWFTEDGEEVTIATIFTEDTTLYAHWEKDDTDPDEPDTPEPPYTITLECNGGSCSQSTLTTDELGQLSSLPTPERSGYTFKGWYTEDGEEITIATVFTENTTIYARWEKSNSDPSNPHSSSGGGGGAGAGIAIIGAGAVVAGVAVAAKVKNDRAVAALPDSSLLHVQENGTEKPFETSVKDKTLTVQTEANTAVLTGSRSYIEQLSAQGYTQLTLAAKTGDKTLYVLPVTKKVTVDINTLLAQTPQDGTFTVTLE